MLRMAALDVDDHTDFPLYTYLLDTTLPSCIYADSFTTYSKEFLELSHIAVSLKRNVRMIRVSFEKIHKLYFFVQTQTDATSIAVSTDFVFRLNSFYRDIKQFTELDNYLARSGNKLDFHFNIALTRTNVARVI